MPAKPTVLLNESAPFTVTYFQARWTVLPAGAAVAEQRTCPHRHRTMRAANECGADMAHAARRESKKV